LRASWSIRGCKRGIASTIWSCWCG